MSDALFDLAPTDLQLAEPDELVSADARRTRRQAALLTRGRHPLGLDYPLPLHTEAAPVDDRNATGRRCRNCRWLDTVPHHNKTYKKCAFPGSMSAADYELIGGLRMTHGPASDVRGWWPGCRDHEPGDPKLPQAMRWVPDPREMR